MDSRERLRQIIAGCSNDPRRTPTSRALRSAKRVSDEKSKEAPNLGFRVTLSGHTQRPE
jgi:hypothetical protein